jgi:hypothetical protein
LVCWFQLPELARRYELVSTERVPSELIVLMKPFEVRLVIFPVLSVPNCPRVAKRLVLDAVVAKSEVVVAEVPVAFWKVKFWRVVEPRARRLPVVERPETVSEPRVPILVREERVVTEELM